jgi:L-malate glycosyltransferase
MRVLYFTAQDSPHDQRFLTALADTPHQVYSLRMYPCAPQTPRGITEISWQGTQPDWASWKGWQTGQRQLENLLHALQPDLLHAGPLQGPALLAALAGFHPLVSMSWGFDLLRTARRSPWMKLATTCALTRSDVLVADCQTVADEAASYGFAPDRVVQFPWGVDLALFSESRAAQPGQALKRALGWENQFVLFCNRSWSAQYGVDVLARAFVRAYHQRPDLRLLLAGGGADAELIRRILAPVGDAVSFPGWVDQADLPKYYGAGDLFISPSHVDGSSVSLIEALACGRPVLVSDIPSNREWVKPGEVGDLFIDGDVISLERQILAMASSPHLTGYGEQARAMAEQRANWKQNFSKLLIAYEMAAT